MVWEGGDLGGVECQKISDAEAASRAKRTDRKVEITKRLHKGATAKNQWMSTGLKMGHVNYVSNLVNG